MKNILIDYITTHQGETEKYTKFLLNSMPEENIIAIAERIYAERQLEKSKPCEWCGVKNCERC